MLLSAGRRRLALSCGCRYPAARVPHLSLRPTCPALQPACAYHLSAVIPLCIAYTFLTRHIDWSGIRYWRAGGKVVRVQH